VRSFFSVYSDCLIERITAEIGYEAVLSDIAFSIKSYEDLGFKLKFSGYNDKIDTFIKIFFEIMQKVHQSGFDEMTIKLAVEKSLKSYKNFNVEVDQRTGNNRLIFLLENVVHASHVIKELESFDYYAFT
jgi:secreted Zn-dependent insulinase-like peptidase